jgi:large subunit ribosomal protein L24
MENKYSKTWNSSIQPRKQRKFRYNAPLHIRHKLISANLSKELRSRYGKRSFPIKKGDVVKIMRGEFKNKTGKINTINLQCLNTSIEGIQKSKKDGTKRNVFFDPSNLQIQELNLEDKKRKLALERKTSKQEKVEKEKNNMEKKNVSKTK